MADFRSLVRRFVPRTLRNSLRNPMTTLRRVRRKVRFALGHTGQVTIREGWTVRCHPQCVEAFDQFRIDPSQRAELDAFIARCVPGMQLLDLGAHWGFLTLAGLHYGGETARSIVVEPSAAAVELLGTNLKLNACADRVTVVNKAAGQAPGTIEMLTTGAGGNDYFIVPSGKRPDTRVVAQTTIDELCRPLDTRPTHVKIDVEGFEEEVLLGGADFLSSTRPIIFLELHGDLILARGREPDRPLRLLQGFGYNRFEQDLQPKTMHQLAEVGYVARLVCSAR